jgi:hypothetical protein
MSMAMVIYTLYTQVLRFWNPTQAKTGLEWGTHPSLRTRP